MDAEGIKIKFWEPVDIVFTAMGRKTIKYNGDKEQDNRN